MITKVYVSKKKKRDQKIHLGEFQHTLKYKTLGKLLKGGLQRPREERRSKEERTDRGKDIREKHLNWSETF